MTLLTAEECSGSGSRLPIGSWFIADLPIEQCNNFSASSLLVTRRQSHDQVLGMASGSLLVLDLRSPESLEVLRVWHHQPQNHRVPLSRGRRLEKEKKMRKTPGATKAHATAGYCKHLRKFGKRLANKASRKAGNNFLTDSLPNKEPT